MMTMIMLLYYGVKKLAQKLIAKNSPACGEMLV